MANKTRSHANRLITRIVTKPPHGKQPVRGYEVRIYRGGKRFNQFFSDKAHGGKIKALDSARAIRDKMDAKIKHFSRRALAVKVSERTTSGLRGLRIRTTVILKNKRKYVYEHVEASWSPEPGKVVKKAFSVEKLGLKRAWELAIECRRKAVAKIRS